MIVEMTGLPGAGKSTCRSRLYTRLAEQGYRVLGPSDVMEHFVRQRIYGRCGLKYECRRILVLRALVAWAYRANLRYSDFCNRLAIGAWLCVPTKARRRSCRALSQDFILYSHYLERIQPSSERRCVYLSSEGLVHHGARARVFAGSRFAVMSGRWLNHHSCSEIVVIHVQTSVEAALERLWSRGVPDSWPQKAQSSRSFAEETLVHFEKSIEESMEEYRQAGVRVLTVDNSSDVPALAAEVERLVASLEGTNP